MTGKELIIYILKNNLENEDIFKDGVPIGFMSVSEAALKFKVTASTISLWYGMGMINGVDIGGTLYIPVDAVKKVLNQNEYYKLFKGHLLEDEEDDC